MLAHPATLFSGAVSVALACAALLGALPPLLFQLGAFLMLLVGIGSAAVLTQPNPDKKMSTVAFYLTVVGIALSLAALVASFLLS